MVSRVYRLHKAPRGSDVMDVGGSNMLLDYDMYPCAVTLPIASLRVSATISI